MCVYAICKNEEKFVDRWMDAVQEADVVVVLDTGSTDDTVARLRARGAQVHEAIIDPWRFDTARNLAMDHIPDDIDICVSNDLDEVFEPGWRADLEKSWRPDATRARYRFIWHRGPDGSVDHESPMEKIHCRKHFRWIHPVHEVLQYSGPGAESHVAAEGVVLEHYPDLTKPRTQYLPLLELSAEENPEDGQTLLWLGREYLYYQRPDDAITTLKRHLQLAAPQWDVERCASARFIAKAYQTKGDKTQAEAWLYRAIAECPDSREPYYDMAMLGYLNQDWSLVLLMTEKALALGNDKRSGYLRESQCWGPGPDDLGSIAAYWLGLYRRSYEYAARALELDPGNDRIAGNLRFAEEKLVPPTNESSTDGGGPAPVQLAELLGIQQDLLEVVDIGANPVDRDPPYLPLLTERLCRVTGFEPQQSALDELRQRQGDLERYLPDAVGDGGVHTLRVCAGSGMTSLFEPDWATLSLFPFLKPFAEVWDRISVPTRRLDDIDEIEHIDYLKIDIQGGELAVFKGGLSKLATAVMIQTEVSFVTLYEGQPSFGDVDQELRSQGFVPHCFAAVKRWPIAPCVVDGNPRRGVNQLLEADVVYVRDLTRPERLNDDQLKRIALLAHSCYASYDLTLRCLEILESRGSLVAGSRRRYLAVLAQPSISLWEDDPEFPTR